jgi:hypothetical protein
MTNRSIQAAQDKLETELTSLESAVASKKWKNNCAQGKKEKTSKEPLLEEQSFAQRALLEAIERQQGGPEGLRAVQLHVVKLFGRIQRLHEQIDQAFGGQPFLPNVGPASPANRRRFNAFFECHTRVSRLFLKVVQLWALTCGMKMEDDWVPIVIVYMNHQAAKARASAKQGAVKE